MGMFDYQQQTSAEAEYKKTIKPRLKKDSYTHVIMVTSFSKWINQLFGVETKYVNQIDAILTLMQKDGFIIVDVTHTALKNQGLFGGMEGFHTLITYKSKSK